MAVILVDYENVNGSNGLKGTDMLSEKDTLIIFYSDCCARIRADSIQDIENSGCEFQVVKLKETGKNALDFYIAAECGIMSERGEANIAIVSRDKGFQAVIDFLCSVNDMSNVQIIRAENIEIALTMIDATEDSERRKAVQQRMLKLDLAVECAKIYERSRLKGKIKEVLKGTEYEYMENEIIDFIQSGNQKGKKELYTGSLHSFGRKNGIGIYNLIKNNITG